MKSLIQYLTADLYRPYVGMKIQFKASLRDTDDEIKTIRRITLQSRTVYYEEGGWDGIDNLEQFYEVV